jgi:hypothetical protein
MEENVSHTTTRWSGLPGLSGPFAVEGTEGPAAHALCFHRRRHWPGAGEPRYPLSL